jgi:HlyD family secretion protein
MNAAVHVDAVHSGFGMDRKMPAPPRWRQTLPRMLLAVLIATVAGPLLWQRPSQLQVVSVPQLAPVVVGEFRDELALRARVEPIRSVLLDAAEAGRVEEVFVQDGAWVEAGTALYQLHSPEQEQMLMERSSEVAQQIANVSLQRSAQAASLAQSRRELTELQSEQQQAESYYRRIASLPDKAVSALAREEAERQHVLTTQLLQQAREDHRVEAEIRQRSLDEMARAVQGLQHGLRLLERSRDRLTQRAPIAGQLSGFTLQVGASVRSGDQLGRIDDASGGMQLTAEIDEFYLPRLQLGQEAPSNAGTLKLVQTLPQVKDGKARVLLRWPEQTSQPTNLRPGQSLDVRLQFSPPSKSLLLPEGPGVQSQLYVRDGDELVRRTVQLGRRAAGQVEILSGLQVGEHVLISQPPSEAARLALP